MSARHRLGFVGFGAMARKMAARLRDAGYSIVAYDPSHLDGDIDGIPMLGNAADVARAVDAVLISVPDDPALSQAGQGPGGVLEGAEERLLLIDTSTVSLQASESLAEAARKRGVRFVEAPVSGSTPEAGSGKLVVLAGGTAADLAEAAPILAVIARKVVHAGPVGQGLALKLVINGVMALGTAALAEGLAYGVSSGLDRDLVIETLQDLILVSEHHKLKLEMAKRRSYPAQFPTRLLSKDMGLLLADAARRGVPMVTMAAASQLFAAAATKHGNEDYAAAIGAMEDLVRFEAGPARTAA